MPKMEGKKREEIAQQMVDTVNWREAHRKESLVGKPQEEAEEEMLNEDLRVSEFMHKNSALSFGLPNAGSSCASVCALYLNTASCRF